MFDILPDAVTAGPIAGIAINGGDTLSTEKVAWEKELLGVTLSESPLKAIALVNSAGAITSSDQLDSDMDGQRVSVLGQLSSVSERSTRDQRPYLVATLELVYGSTEVIAWPDVLEKTRELWREGNLLLVSGRLRIRGDELSVHCDQARLYTEEIAPGDGTLIGEARVSPGAPLLSRSPERSEGAAKGSEKLALGLEQPDARLVPQHPAGLIISMVESDDAEEDAHLLREAIRTLLEYSGADRVHLEIFTRNEGGGKRVLLDLPMITTGYCSELRQRLEELLGADSVRVED